MSREKTLTDGLAAIAEAELGNGESPRGSNRGVGIQKYFRADDYVPNKNDDGYPWCASFICYCVATFSESRQGELFRNFPLPRTAAAYGLVEWAKKAGCFIFPPKLCTPKGYWPQRGDVVVYNFSHCGIITAAGTPDRHFSAVEGNTDSQGSREGWEVARKARVFGQVKMFIRLTPRAQLKGAK